MQPSVIAPLAASVLVVFAAPYVGQIRATVERAFPEYYRSIIGTIVVVAVATAIAAAVTSIRYRQKGAPGTGHEPRAAIRYLLIGSALLVATTYAAARRRGNVDVDIVEAFHFVEYGLIAYLYYRIWRTRPDLGAVVFPACCALLVGIADEFIQWFVPNRVGELRDILLNAVAIGCGLLFSMALHAPRALKVPAPGRPRTAVGVAVACLVVAGAAFVDRVHLAYEVRDRQTVFRSQYDSEMLAAAAADRAVRWRTSQLPSHGFAREDHYLMEGTWHVGHRNGAVAKGDIWAAWNENVILERFYAPVLDLGFRWPGEQRAQIEAAARKLEQSSYVSDAQGDYPMYLVRRSTFWLLTALLAAVIVAISRAGRAHAALTA